MIKLTNNTALIWEDTEINYQQLLQNIARYAELIDGNSVKKVSIFSENRFEWVYSFYAGWVNNCINIPIDFMSTTDETAYILNDVQPEIIFYSENTESTLHEALKSVSHKTQIIKFEDINEINTASVECEFPEFKNDQTAVIIYTSGTTGNPKGVMLSFENLMTNIGSVTKDVPIYTANEKVLLFLPLHHTFPLLGAMIAPLHVGGTVVFSPSLKPEDILSALQKNAVTIIIGVPRFYAMIQKGIKEKISAKAVTRFLFNMAQKIDSMSFSKLLFKKVHDKFGGHIKYLVSGGAALDPLVARDYFTLGFEILEGYGMTETAPMITFSRPGKVKIGSAGNRLNCNEIKIIDDEIVTSGKNVMLGYYNKQKETDEVLKDGWLYTGDLGYVDDNGYLFITGRKKEIIVLSNGKNISPVAIEQKLQNISPYINEIAVILHDDQLHALIYPDSKSIQANNISDVREMMKWDVIDKYNQEVQSYKKISNFTIINTELPKTRLQKIKRFELEPLLSTPAKSVPQGKEPEFREYQIIRDYLHQQIEKPIFPADHLELELGLDSLDKVGFLFFLNSTFGVELNEEQLSEFSSIEKVAEFIKKKQIKIEVDAVKWSEIIKEQINIQLPTSWFTHSLIKNLANVILKLYFRIKSEGTENLPDITCIIAPNHQSYFDGLFVTIFFKNKFLKKTYFYAKEKHIRQRWLKFLAKTNNVIVVDINLDLKLSIQKLAEVLRKGKNIVIFPEGTRTNDGNLQKFKKTFAILSRELNVPIIPVAISGAFDALPKGTRFPKPWKKINVKFLKPVYPQEFTYDALKDLIYKKVSAHIAVRQQQSWKMK